MAPTRAGPGKPAKRRGRPPGSRNSLPTSRRVSKQDAAKVAPVRKRKANIQKRAGQAGAKRNQATGARDSEGKRTGRKRRRPARTDDGEHEDEEQEEVDELSFTQPEVVPTPMRQPDKQRRGDQLGSAGNRGRHSRTRDPASPDVDANEGSAQQSKSQYYVQLAPRTRRIAREVIETWPHVSPQVLDQVVETLRDAKKDIVNTQRDENRAISADEALGSMVRMLARQLSSSRIPPQAKDIDFNIDKLTERYAQLFGELTTERHSQQLLGEQAKVAQHLLKKDEEGLEQLKKNARDWKARWKQQEKQGRMHPLLKDVDGEMEGDGPDDIGLKRSAVVDVSMIDTPDSELAPHVEQLRRSLESMQGNHEQVAGIDVGMTRAQVALDDVLFKHASAAQYAAL